MNGFAKERFLLLLGPQGVGTPAQESCLIIRGVGVSMKETGWMVPIEVLSKLPAAQPPALEEKPGG